MKTFDKLKTEIESMPEVVRAVIRDRFADYREDIKALTRVKWILTAILAVSILGNITAVLLLLKK